jgi:hypothetical protein
MEYPSRRWPVEQAGTTIVYTNRPSRRQALAYDERVEWMTDWGEVLERLVEIHGEEAIASVYPCAKIQFDAERNPLEV